MTQRVAVIDYGMGNLHSVASALEHVGALEVVVTHDHAAITKADRVVFPGVGGIRDCMDAIRRLECDQLLEQAITVERKPVLAICVGMQSLMTASEENGGVACLNQLPGEVRFFGSPHQEADGTRLKVPHMGWNQVVQKQAHPLWTGIESGSHFYFVHSYHVVPDDPGLVVGTFDYGLAGCAALATITCLPRSFTLRKATRLDSLY